MTLKERLSAHRYKGAIFEHFHLVHGCTPTIDLLSENTEILYRETDAFQLHIYEALHIRKYRPSLNSNTSDFSCLKLNIY